MLHLLSKGGENRFQSKDDLLLFFFRSILISQIGSNNDNGDEKKAEQSFERVI
jgi:hypothetical protein